MCDAEALARWAYERAFVSLEQPPGPAALLQRIVGAERIEFHNGHLSRVTGTGDMACVHIPRSLPDEQLCLAMAHAVVLLADACGAFPCPSGHELERAIAAVIMPRPAVMRALRTMGPRIERIAEAFVVPRRFAAEHMRTLGLGLASGEFRRHSFRRAAS